jgi:adenylate cyclase
MKLSRLAPYRTVVIAVFTWLAVAGASSTGSWDLLELRGFDLWSRLAVRPPTDSGITIVGIDESSFGELQQQWPWPRGVHGKLVDALNRAGAAVIAFDVVFAEPSVPEEDAAFAEAIGRAAGAVVLAGDLATQETAYASQVIEIEPLIDLRNAGAEKGVAAVNLDGDMVLRRVPSDKQAFWRAVLRADQRPERQAAAELPVDDQMFIRYAGPDHTFRYVSYYQALDPDTFLPRDSLKGRLVLIGRDVKASPEPGAAQPDMFATPFSAATSQLTPGVEFHANAIATMMNGSAIHPIARMPVLALLALVVVLAAWLMRNWRPIPSALVGLLLTGAWVGGSLYLFAYQNQWLPVLTPLAGVGLVYVAQGGTAFLTEQARRRQIKQAFGFYVSPAVVNEMVAHPERLKLGGERRVLTILFNDLAGFTTLAESLSAEEAARILNEHLTAMTTIVLHYGGTVDKFIGDAVMAFWNAPLDDPDHAYHACQAAIDMQADLARRRERPGQTGLSMRIGIATGPVVVGNMGSDMRFDYSAIGDNVNLASRLEGVNKAYGTHTLVAGSTVAALNGRMPSRLVDRVRVKGKTEVVEIFTLDGDVSLTTKSDQAIEAYRRQDWDQSLALWRSVLDQSPDDAVAGVYLKRIPDLRHNNCGADWDGSVALEKM